MQPRPPMAATRLEPELDRAFRLAVQAQGTTVSAALRLLARRYVHDVAAGRDPLDPTTEAAHA